MIAITIFCMIGHLLVIKLAYIFVKKIAYFSLACLAIFLFVLLNPFPFFHRHMRWELFKTLFLILVSPFSPVRFRHFFLADIVTSFGKSLQDISFSVCFFTSLDFFDSTAPICPSTKNTNYALSFVPYHIRFWQCLRRYYDSKLTLQLLNAGKYFSSMMVQLTNIFRDRGDFEYYLWIAVCIISTTYSLVWDLYVDWGLFRTAYKGRLFLREKITYPVWFYYYAIVMNTILRFLWILSLMPPTDFAEWFTDFGVIIFFLQIAEAYRRC